LLGAAAYGDLGTYFPVNDESIKGISGSSMLSTVLEKLSSDNYKIINVDITYVGQEPKLMPHREPIRKNLSKILGIDIENISCKATTTDGLGFEGSLEGISCHCVVLIDN
jgi:2-C-methyl-D-erythritol 2,4-cyclodiphosphate synthase